MSIIELDHNHSNARLDASAKLPVASGTITPVPPPLMLSMANAKGQAARQGCVAGAKAYLSEGAQRRRSHSVRAGRACRRRLSQPSAG